MYTTYADYGNGKVKLTWVPTAEQPPVDRITSVHGICFWQGKVLLVDLKSRGFDIPGGHVEPGEGPAEAMQREAYEEGYVRCGVLNPIGYVIVDHSENPNWEPGGKYPLVGYQLFYRVEVAEVLTFAAQFESARRIFVAPHEVPQYYHGWTGLGVHIMGEAIAHDPVGVAAKRLYIVRHCKAGGQEPDAELTGEGRAQANALSVFLKDAPIDRIVCSPFLRARQSVEPLAEVLGIPVEVDERLAERVLADGPLPDWMDRLRDSFDNPDLRLEGGESGRQATERAVAAVAEILQGDGANTVVVSHGNLITLLLGHFDDQFGFAEWQVMTNPDVYLVTVTGDRAKVDRVWK